MPLFRRRTASVPAVRRHPSRREVAPGRAGDPRLPRLFGLVLAVGAVVVVVAARPVPDAGGPAVDARAAGSPPPLAAAPALTTGLPPAAAQPGVSAPAGTETDTAPGTSTPPAGPVLQVPGRVPDDGRGSFGYDDRVGPVLGTAGEVQRYRVAVERGAGEDPEEFAAAVRTALAGPGSWVDGGRLRLRQVGRDSRHDFTVHLATARTAGLMCAAGGVDIRVGGRPYTSCRAPGKVIINLERWRLSVPHYVRAGVPLSVYRTYVVNHEVGHQLGNRHERCPGRGRPAPVMMQQTLFLNGCVANPWPYRDGRRYQGPPL